MKKIVSFLLISTIFLCTLAFVFYYDDGTAKDYKLGVGISASVKVQDAEGDEAGRASASYTFAAVVIDKNGRVVSADFDVSYYGDAEVASNGAVVIVKPMTTKVELGDAYVMNPDDPKWVEQVDALEAVMRGKTLDEVKNLIASDYTSKDEVISAGCTIYISDFIFAIEKAFANAKDVRLTDTKVSLGISVSSSATSADADASGSVEFDGVATAAVMDGDKVSACMSDELAVKLSVLADGKIEGKAPEYKSKRELKEAYGMGSVTTEWYLQVDKLNSLCAGKTASEVALLATGNAGEVQTAGCTIYAGTLVSTIQKAAEK